MSGHDHPTGITADEALERLRSGNERFLRGAARLRTDPKEVLASLVQGQQPFATLLGCSDSRVAPELVFDVGLGELFVIRVAGNVLSAEIAGSIQYAGMHLKTPLFVVLGHEGCGAVQAALAVKFKGASVPSRIALLLESLMPALEEVDPKAPPEVQAAQATEANVRWTLRQIAESPEGRARAAEGLYKVAGAIYEMSTGRVRFFEPA